MTWWRSPSAAPLASIDFMPQFQVSLDREATRARRVSSFRVPPEPVWIASARQRTLTPDERAALIAFDASLRSLSVAAKELRGQNTDDAHRRWSLHCSDHSEQITAAYRVLGKEPVRPATVAASESENPAEMTPAQRWIAAAKIADPVKRAEFIRANLRKS